MLKVLISFVSKWIRLDPLRLVRGNTHYTAIPLCDYSISSRYLKYRVLSLRKHKIYMQALKKQRLAVLIPYRHREENLKKLLPKLKEALVKDNIDYDIFVCEQKDEKPFNKGRLLNSAVDLLKGKYQHLCFHDVDLAPIKSSYKMMNHPVALVSHAEQFSGSVHPHYFGGVLLFTLKDYQHINGFSNEYWHWGREDDDMFFRMLLKGLSPIRQKEGIYQSLKHKPSIQRTPDGHYHEDERKLAELKALTAKNNARYRKFKKNRHDYSKDGLNNVNYEIIDCKKKQDYTFYSISF